ncbi:hypothetical protein COY91_01265 [Candidatus Shapirobacteria bacterium CG_4_10_14_0_8_um_filter_39_15]|nr:MAG: hypothetical protein COY91_01265 [Candidatus Shapirobacteria bacterium CG_4_10_14_0_8_um_filter_39_15]
MEIVYYGCLSFRIKGKNVSIATDLLGKVEVEDSGSVFPIQHPGEYEIKGASIFGFSTSENNICYLFELEGLRLFHLGNIKGKLTDKQLGEIGEVDVLFVPVGGKDTLVPKEAMEVISQVEPKIVIPMNFDSLDEFLKEEGDGAETLPKLTISKLDLPIETKTVILERKSG